jgi:uncharacterized protein (TIGR03089 family)
VTPNQAAPSGSDAASASDQTLVAALAQALQIDPGRPLVTFYDEATGERVELSVKTFDNWVSKIANLFVDELGLEAGDSFSVDLPAHWLTPVVLVGGWTAGLVLGDEESAAVHVVGPGRVGESTTTPSGVVVACSLRPLGARFLEPLPHGWLDFAVEVAAQPDVLVMPHDIGTQDPAIVTRDLSARHGELVAAGRQAAAELRLRAGGRLATDLNPVGAVGVVTALAAPLAAAAALVLVVNASPERRTGICDQEGVTTQAWAPIS